MNRKKRGASRAQIVAPMPVYRPIDQRNAKASAFIKRRALPHAYAEPVAGLTSSASMPSLHGRSIKNLDVRVGVYGAVADRWVKRTPASLPSMGGRSSPSPGAARPTTLPRSNS